MDINISDIKNIPTPQELINEFSLNQEDILFIENSRSIIKDILVNNSKLLVIIGPCSIHDPRIALEYANHVKQFQDHNPNLYIVMRVYFEKPRSRHGWKGFIYDPDLNNTYNINKGLRLARELLVKLTKLRIPIGCEFLDTISPQYLADTVSWGAIGARTSESQIHRQLASGLSMPIGFKNLTDGDYHKAIDGLLSARYPHHFLGIDYKGSACHITTKGNEYSHLILRGGVDPNYYQENVEEISKTLKKENIKTGIIIDCSHGNSQKEYMKQILVASSINRLKILDKYPISGVMIESNILGGNQSLKFPLQYGVSITDACIDIDSSNTVLSILNSNKVDKIMTNLTEIRDYLFLFEKLIIQLVLDREEEIDTDRLNNILSQNINMMDIVINYDDELFSITKEIKLSSLLLCLLHKRLSMSELIADIKYKLNPYHFLLKDNDYYKLVTDRNIEKSILGRINSDTSLDNYHPGSPITPINSPKVKNIDINVDLYIKLMELSKRIQVKYLEKFVLNKRIGYIGNKATISYEVINKNFNGIHIGCSTVNDIYTKLNDHDIEYGLIPTYNSLVGILFMIPETYKIIGFIDYKVRLSVYANNEKTKPVVLYIQEIMYREVASYINKKYKDINIIFCDTSEEGCLKCIENKDSITVASISNKCNFLYLVSEDIIDHNVTTFSVIKNKLI
jgi:3-deoxy-7-phosphoheptulonate synthase